MIQDFIIVDDDPINNMLCQLIIEQEFSQANVQSFTDPCVALKYIESTYATENLPNAVLFLDINMPALTGWEFLDTFQLHAAAIKQNLKIYMLSSSVDPADKQRADNNKNVMGYIEKPLTTKTLEFVISKL